ncbi:MULTISPECIES: DUF1800 family protein [Sphingobacterium]|uniref:DUF1800 domain-containing protein n=1 Tax=Sphingobacterium TaxID=28453 RepID=UPI0013DC4308|nr:MULTISPECIES: DUF1800 domain-containing protein [unclassified Sphingobacterium]
MEKSKNLHLLWRSGFGPALSDIQKLDKLTTRQLWQNIKSNSLTVLPDISPSSSFVQDNYDKSAGADLSKAEKEAWNRKIRQQSAKDIKEFNQQWIRSMVNSTNQLGEKVSFFWHHHFAIRHPNSFLQQDAVNSIRRHALGNFRDLLSEVSKSGAMVLSLNNQQNRKSSPNENFAREIMELFTMGIGHYTEQDIKEAARAFTGWGVGKDGRFAFHRRLHDDGIKQILGKTGRFNGDDVIDIILDHPQTPVFIVTKVYRYFVSETVDQHRVQVLAAAFRKDYNIRQLLDSIFDSEWFYASQYTGNRVKSPIELLVGMQRLSPVAAIEEQLQYRTQKQLGQVLFNPPSIAGWPSGKNWLDSSTLMVRLQLPQIIAGAVTANLRTKSDDDTNMGLSNPDDIVRLQQRGRIVSNPAWNLWLSQQNESTITTSISAAAIPQETRSLLQRKSGGDKNEYAQALMNLPEYQLC